MLEMPRRLLTAAAILVALGGVPRTAGAQIPGIEEWADAVASGLGRRWEGPRVPSPEPRDRPPIPVAARSWQLPVAVHATADVPPERVERTLESLEAAWVTLAAQGWGTPWPDGGRGDTAAFDLYLAPGLTLDREGEGEHDAHAEADAPVAWSYLDAVSSFAVVPATVDPEALEACVVDAYAQALLLALDPAEARQWRRATSSWLAFQLTGRWGCAEHVVQQQREPWRSWIGGAAGDGSGGALFLAMLSSRHDRGTGTFIRDLWQLARQRTWEGHGLRASPDLWEALEVAVEGAGDDLLENIEELAVARWFGGDPERERNAPVAVVRALPPEATVPHIHPDVGWEELPEHPPAAEPALEPYGSGYLRIDTSAAPEGRVLRIWMRGEYGVRWSLVAMRRDARGRELSRLSAPPRREPRSYLVVELLDDTDEVIVAVTNLSSRLPDTDEDDGNVRSFELIVSETYGEEEEAGEGEAASSRP